LSNRLRGLLFEARPNRAGHWLGAQARVAATSLDGRHVFVGERSWVEPSARLGENVVLAADVVIDRGARLRNCLVRDGTYIGKNLDLENAIVAGPLLARADTGIVTEVGDPFLLASTQGRKTPAWRRSVTRWLEGWRPGLAKHSAAGSAFSTPKRVCSQPDARLLARPAKGKVAGMKDVFVPPIPDEPWGAHDFRQSLDAVLRSYLPLVFAGLAFYYALLTVSHAALLAGTTRIVMMSASGTTLAILLGLAWHSLSGKPPIGWALPMGFGVAVLTLLNSLLHLAVTRDVAQTINIVLVVSSAGALLLSGLWLNLLIVVSVASWVAVMYWSAPPQAWGHYAYAIFSAAIIANLVRFLQVRTHREVWDLHREREAAQAALIERAAREAAILESALDCIVVMDAQGLVVEFNPAAEATFGYRRHEVVGRLMAELIVPPALRPAHYDGLKRFFATGAGPVLHRRIEITAMRAGGEEFPVELAIVPIGSGGNTLFSAYLRDITERKRSVIELAGARDRAEAASLAKSRFLATMSHEIRTPLNPVIALTSVLLEGKLDPQQRNYVERIRQSGLLLLRRISDVLDFSKIEARRMEIECVDFSLREALQQMIDLFEQQAAAKELLLECAVAPEVPDWVRSDPGRLQQILSNLMSNAIKFTDHGFVRLEVAYLDGDTARPSVRFAVRDSGIGISEQERQQLFEPFRQGDSSSTRRLEGSGLGLAIAHELVHLLGGEIACESVVGEGSRFSFTLQLAIATTPPVAAEPKEAAETPESRELGGARILVVEDNSINQEVLMLMLRLLGHSVDLAGDGREAIEAVQQRGYDLVLMDCQMPNVDGYAATAEIRRLETKGARLPIIAVTAYAGKGDRERCFAAGMDDFLGKPVDLDQLRSILHHWLKERAKATSCVVDGAVLDGLRELESPSHPPLVNRLLSNWINRTPERLERMRQGLEQSDLEAIANEAHSMKSESGNLGAMAYSDLASRLQDAARNGDLEACRALVDALFADLAAVSQAFREQIRPDAE